MSTEAQKSLQIQIVLFFGVAIVVGMIGSLAYVSLMPAFYIPMDPHEFLNRTMYAIGVSLVFSAIAGVFVIIGIVKVLQYFKT